MKQRILFFLLLACSAQISAKTIGNCAYGNLKNKAELVVINESRSDIQLTLNVKLAPYIETVQNAGISRLVCYTIFANLVRLDPAYNNTKISFHPDYSTFVFTLPNQPLEVERILSNIYKSVLIDTNILNKAKELTIQSYKDETKDISLDMNIYENLIQQAVWGDYHFRKYQKIEETVVNQMNGADVMNIYDKYFKPSNSLFIYRGKATDPEQKFGDINESTLYEDKVENYYVPIGKTNIYKNLISTSQIIYNDTERKEANKVIITFQITGNYQNANGLHKLMILCAMLNKYSNTIFPNTKNVHLNLKTEKFAAELSLTYTPTSMQKQEFYEVIQRLNNLQIDSICSKNDYAILLKKIINMDEAYRLQADKMENNVSFWWNILSIDDYTQFAETTTNIRLDDVKFTFNKYVRNCPFVMLMNNSSLLDTHEESSLQSVDDTSVYSTFYYDYNLSDLTRDSEKEKLWKVLQWLYINNNLNVQVNGHADRNEYLKTDASELNPFIEEHPQFKLISAKKGKAAWQRLDTVRALKIVKFLVENGIDGNRIKGSGVLLDSEDREGMQENQKVDFSYLRFRVNP